MKCLSIIITVMLFMTVIGENAVFNSGFELGIDGFELNWLSNPVKNPKLIFHNLRVEQENAAEGKQFLRIDNPYGEVFELHSREFRLEAGKSCTLSFSARSNVADATLRVTVYGIMPDRRSLGYDKAFKISSKWETYSFPFTPNGTGYYHIAISPGNRHAAEIPSGYIALDNIQLDNGMPAPTLEVAVASSSDLYEQERDKTAKLTLKVRNNSNTPVHQTLKIRGTEVYFNHLLWEKSFSVALAPGEMTSIPFEAPLNFCGGIRAEIENMPEAFAGYYAVISHYDVRPINIRNDFCVGINGAVNHEERRSFYPAYYARGKSVDDNLSQLARIGIRLIRERDGGAGMAQWRYLEPEEGVFDFKHADFLLALYKKHRLEPLPIFSDDFIEEKGVDQPGWHQRGHLPKWLLAKCTRVKNDPPNVMRSARSRIMLPPRDLYQRYVRAFAERYQGKVQAIELMNEANLWIAPEVYMDYLKVASAELRTVAPSMMLIGLCPTGDKESETAMPWTRTCVNAGALRLVDAISFHPYNSRELNSALPADSYIEALKRILETEKLPVWNTELYYCYDVEGNDKRDPQTCSADQVSRRFLTDLGEGVAQSICMHSFGIGLWYSKITPNLNNPEGSMGLHPSPAMVAYNALARYFEAAKPIAKFRLPRQIICYGFRDRLDKPLAAVWNYGEGKGVMLDFSGMEIRDLFGNRVDAGKPLEITRAPFFLFPGQLSEQEFLAQLGKLQVLIDTPVTVSSVARLYNGRVHIGLHNDSDAQVSAVIGFRGESVAAQRPERIALKPGEYRTIALPVRESGEKQQSPEVMLNVNRRMLRYPVKLYRNCVRSAGEKISLQSADGILRGTVVIRREGNKLVMEFRVADKTDAGKKGTRYFWESDSIELFLDFNPGEFFGDGQTNHPERYQQGTFRLFLMPREAKEEQLFISGSLFRHEDTEISVDADSNGYAIRIELPAGDMRVLGMDIKINDAVASDVKAVRSASFSQSTIPHLDRFVFNIINLN